MNKEKSQESNMKMGSANIDRRIMEETDKIKGIITHIMGDKCYDFYPEYKKLEGQLPKPLFRDILNKFFDLTVNLYIQDSSIYKDSDSKMIDAIGLWKEYIQDDISNPPSYEKIEMSVEEFWQVIENVKYSDNPYKSIKIHLDKLPIGKLISYQEHFDIFHNKANRWDIWGAAYIGNNGCSDDSFMDFRNWLISRGKNVYEAVLENPDNLVELDLKYCTYHESFGHVAERVYEEKMDKMMPTIDLGSDYNPLGKNWDFTNEDENKKRLPRLWKKYKNYDFPVFDSYEYDRIFGKQ